MSAQSFTQKRKAITKEKRLERIHYAILIALMIVGVLYYYFLEPAVIGHDNRYTVFIFLLPTAAGMLALAFYRKAFLLQKLGIAGNFFSRFIIIAFYLIQGFLFSFLSIGLVSRVTFNYVNNNAAQQNSKEIISCEITRFWTGKHPSIDFKFENRPEHVTVDNAAIKEYENKKPGDYKIKLSARKGLWNYYVVDDWTIKERY